jgi:probable F420-dependent oxidoreductase
MRLGVVFPQTEIGADPMAIRDYVQAVEEMGFQHLLAFDHVLGANSATYDFERLKGPYREADMFHEPFVLFGYLAAITRRLELGTSVLILTQRQTALVAKQAAEVDVLSGGRMRLGVGTGWNWVEYEALGVPFGDRGARLEEQVGLLRKLWTAPLVTFKGRFHSVPDAGINPLPIRRPIPIWFGGMAENVIRRVGTIGDGWYPQFPSLDPFLSASRPRRNEDPKALIERMWDYARKAGRDPKSIGIEGRIVYGRQTPDDWHRTMDLWRKDLGATHVSFNTMRSGLKNASDHIAAIKRMKESI